MWIPNCYVNCSLKGYTEMQHWEEKLYIQSRLLASGQGKISKDSQNYQILRIDCTIPRARSDWYYQLMCSEEPTLGWQTSPPVF